MLSFADAKAKVDTVRFYNPDRYIQLRREAADRVIASGVLHGGEGLGSSDVSIAVIEDVRAGLIVL